MTQALTRVVDVLVVRAGNWNVNWFAPSDVVVAVETESPGDHLEERLVRRALYARFGIQHYWRIELEPEPIAVL